MCFAAVSYKRCSEYRLSRVLIERERTQLKRLVPILDGFDASTPYLGVAELLLQIFKFSPIGRLGRARRCCRAHIELNNRMYLPG